MPVKDTAAMITGMAPVRRPGAYVYCIASDPAQAGRLAGLAFALIREDEGVTLVLPRALAAAEGFDCSLVMACLTLTVHSALDGVGLTAAVATALAEAGVSCNVIAAYHHDHVFVPEVDADRAIAVLETLAAGHP